MDLRHILQKKDALLSIPMHRDSLVRLAFQRWSAWQDLHLQPSRFERDASSLGHTRMVLPVRIALTLNGV